MAVRRIVQHPDSILKQRANKVVKFEDRLHKLLDDLKETMYDANGVGLAATQVGVLKRAFVVDIGNGPIEVVNPEIAEKTGWQVDILEGCLSIPHVSGIVRRAMKIKITYQDRNGKPIEKDIEGYLARVFQHEIDHLDGILFLDRAEKIFTRGKEEE